jgi:hypothetical protein
VSATSRQPLSMTSEWPRPGISVISVTALLRPCRLNQAACPGGPGAAHRRDHERGHRGTARRGKSASARSQSCEVATRSTTFRWSTSTSTPSFLTQSTSPGCPAGGAGEDECLDLRPPCLDGLSEAVQLGVGAPLVESPGGRSGGGTCMLVRARASRRGVFHWRSTRPGSLPLLGRGR